MASTIINLPQGVWTQVTTTDKEGSIRHKHGESVVLYLEASTAPTTFDENTPDMEQTYKGDGFPYWGVASGEFVFAYSLNGDSELVVSPSGA